MAPTHGRDVASACPYTLAPAAVCPCRELASHYAALRAWVRTAAVLDALCALAVVARLPRYTRPRMRPPTEPHVVCMTVKAKEGEMEGESPEAMEARQR